MNVTSKFTLYGLETTVGYRLVKYSIGTHGTCTAFSHTSVLKALARGFLSSAVACHFK